MHTSDGRLPIRAAFALIAAIAAGACNSPSAPTGPPAVSAPPPVARVSDPPTLNCPGPIAITAPFEGPALANFHEPDVTAGESPVTVTCRPASNASFPIGNTTVECVATDALQRTASCSFAVAVTAAPRLSRNRFVAFGDSITVGEQVVPNTDNLLLSPDPSASYPAALAQLLKARYADRPVVINAGLSGEKAAFADRRFPLEIGKNNADAVIVLEGANDLLYSDPPSTAAIDAVERGISVLAAEGRNRGVRVFIALLTPTKPGRRNIPLATIQFENDRLRQVARGEGAQVIDTFGALIPDLNANIGSDGLHPTAAGYRKIAETVYAAIRADLEIH
jgi:lysophospholipase L1-like esterase